MTCPALLREQSEEVVVVLQVVATPLREDARRTALPRDNPKETLKDSRGGDRKVLEEDLKALGTGTLRDHRSRQGSASSSGMATARKGMLAPISIKSPDRDRQELPEAAVAVDKLQHLLKRKKR